ncbi:unnamed protein product [Paramecium pentaurelia]|uniref:Uncharacterized protein n=1 Tax=Paramecium pentaurelia TaxID=43138 RepID=A0A8S1UT20_9CILI|nr:unnamed protein product [Paramecium pentaurelia]
MKEDHFKLKKIVQKVKEMMILVFHQEENKLLMKNMFVQVI